jgi:phosphate transport system permease protein
MPVQPGAGVVGRADEAARMVASRKRWDRFFMIGGAVLSFLCIALLAVLVADLVRDAWPRLEWGFLTRDQSNDAAQAGIKTAILGTALVMIVTAATAIPLGIAAGIYLEEYAKKNWFTTIIEINIANLAGVPSIIWGLMALGLLVYGLKTGQSILTAGLTLGLLVLPIVIVATRESIRAIPQGIREASFACGASRLQTVRYHILPYSMSDRGDCAAGHDRSAGVHHERAGGAVFGEGVALGGGGDAGGGGGAARGRDRAVNA